MQKITPFLWFDDNGEEAMNFYATVFKDVALGQISRLPATVPGTDGPMATGTFKLYGQDFMILNGGPQFKFTQAISFFISCEDQAEVDEIWNKLAADGGKEQPCGWVQDKFGLSWQVIPKALGELMGDPDGEKAARVMKAMLGMTKIEVAGLQAAYDGK